VKERCVEQRRERVVVVPDVDDMEGVESSASFSGESGTVLKPVANELARLSQKAKAPLL
jgi:hypothetical protein